MNLETITALTTPPGRGAVGILRVSGPKTTEIAQAILGTVPHPRTAQFAKFRDAHQEVLDHGLVLFFPGPNSFTGEDVLELQGHGGPIILDCLLTRILSLGARLARPGEFSERAFLNDKLDLAQAEAIADLIDASSAQAALAAVRSLQGEFSKQINDLVMELIHLRTYVEAAIDFPEEEIDFLSDGTINSQLMALLEQLAKIQAAAHQGCLLREGMQIVIIGRPNAGKSSLLNSLSERDLAIVTDIPGTTRDVLRDVIQIDGLPVHVIDTAGLRRSDDPIEQAGMNKALEEIVKADRVLLLTDCTQPHAFDEFLLEHPSLFEKKITHIRNKIDLLGETPQHTIVNDTDVISLSAKNGDGLALLKEHLKMCMGFQTQESGNFSARRRHLTALAQAEQFILNGQKQLQMHRAGELLAEDLRQAQQTLSEITGEFTADDLLGKIFSSFCVGK